MIHLSHRICRWSICILRYAHSCLFACALLKSIWWRRAKMHSSHAFLQSCSFVIVHFYIVQKCLRTIAFSLKSIWGMGHAYAIALSNLIHLCNSQGVRPVIQLLVCSKWNRFKSEKIHLYFKNAKQICMIAFQVQICKNAFLSIFAEHHAFCIVHFAAVHFCPIGHYLLSHRACRSSVP